MNDLVNLVPAACLQRRARGQRRNVWTALTVALAAFVVSVWSLGGTAGGAVTRAAQRLQDAQARQRALTQALADANANKARLAGQLRLLTQLRHRQPWANRLADLTAEAPLGVLLTRIAADPTSGVSAGREPGAERGRGGAPDATSERPRRDKGDALVIQLSGIAVDHDELRRFIETLQRSDGWGRVELSRAARQPFLNGYAVSFELQCAAGEAAAPSMTGGAP